MLPIGDDDQKFAYLQSASTDVCKWLTDDKSKLMPYVLVAIDSDVSESEPVLEEVETAVKSHWSTYRNKFTDVPRQLLRAVILQAIGEAAQKDDTTIPAIVWLTGSNLLNYVRSEREQEVINPFLISLGQQIEEMAVQAWSRELSINVQPADTSSLGLEVSQPKAPTVDEAKLRQHLMAASGPLNSQGQPSGPNPNPNWPSSPQAWINPFAERAATGIAEAVNNSIATTQDNLSDSFRGLHSQVDAIVTSTIERALQSGQHHERRTSLLWWKQTLYSPFMKDGYRAMAPAIATFCLAYDLYLQSPGIYPQSLEYLLRETCRDALGEVAEETSSVEELCQQILDGLPQLKVVELTRHIEPARSGRISLVELLEDVLRTKKIPQSIAARTGIPDAARVAQKDLAVWLFRNLQARHLAESR